MGPPGPAGPEGAPGAGFLWVDATGLVLGPALSASAGNYVDADGFFWPTDQHTGAVLSHTFQEVEVDLYTGLNCTGIEFVAGPGPGRPMEVFGVLRGVPLTAASGTWVARSQRAADGTCHTDLPAAVCAYLATSCFETADVLTFPILTLPGPFSPPLHAEWR